MNKIAIIAGTGDLPKIIYSESMKQGREPILITFEGENANNELDELNSLKVHYGKVGKIIEYIKNNNCKDVILVGSFGRPSLKKIRGIDWKGASLISKIAKSRGDNNSLEIIINFIKNENLNVLGVKDIIPSLFLDKGVHTLKKPSKTEVEDIEIGKKVLNSLSQFDIGQSLVVSSRRILGIEGPEGTDNLIERCSEMPYEQKPIMVKLLKLNQDIRVDLPTIGMETIKLLSKHNFSGIAIQSYLTIILDQGKVIEFANKENIFIEAI